MVADAQRPWLASYPPDVPADFDVPPVPLTQLLDDAADGFPGAVAISSSGVQLTYRQLAEQVASLAAGLTQLGLRRGDRVALVLPNTPQHVVGFFAVLRCGGVVVHCSPLATREELRNQLADSGASVVICLDRRAGDVLAIRPETAVTSIVVTSLADGLPAATQLGLRVPTPARRVRRARLVARVPDDPAIRSYRTLARTRGDIEPVTVDPARDVAVLQYTGGTTGEPKAAMLSHANLVANSHQIRLWLPDAMPGREVTLAVLPLFHVYGLTLCLLSTVLMAGRLVLLPRFDLDAVFEAIDVERPTLFPGVPPIYQALVDSPKVRRHDLRSIRACISGAMKLPVDVQERFENVTGGRLVEGYGMTEASPATHCTPLASRGKPGAVGVPLPGTDARIVDSDDPARVLAPGETGELAVHGPQVFLGYWGRDADTSALSPDGWLLTGDLAVMDDEGWFTVVDRKKDLIIAGGFNISPAEVEQVITAVPGVTECCVAGLPDRYRGETVKAYVVRSPGSDVTAEQIVRACAERLSAYKVPKLVEFRDELPRTLMGKALRRQLVAADLAGDGDDQ